MIVYGRVQGTNYRYYTKRRAQELGLKGYVKNLSDGTVEVVVEGDEGKLKELIEFCKNSPGISHVTSVKIRFENAKNVFDGFVVEY